MCPLSPRVYSSGRGDSLTLILAPLSYQPLSQVLRWAAIRVSAAAVGTGPTGVRKCVGGGQRGELKSMNVSSW